ncbi:MAG: CPBP family intramembrane metalloprotease [Paludibacteraceae bacterium]|nr:CPBP family intramembrane metalloprotease [Paludibacteraceae bacterium]
MHKPLIRILYWLGLMALLTAIAMILWAVVSGGSHSTTSLKWLQFMQTIATFLLPSILGAWIWSEGHKPFTWLRLTQTTHWSHYLLAVGIMLCAVPGINFLADLNSRIVLPESLGFIEQILKQQEEAAAVLTERFLQADSIGGLLINIGLMALLPALAEEVSFRGTLQQILAQGKLKGQIHIAIWATAFIFSAIHMQFYGFVPRMLMGAMFGYIFVWTGTLWVPILMHFTNNGLAVMAYYLIGENEESKSIADTFGAGDTWWVGVISLLITSLGLLIFYRRTHTR